MGEGPVLGRPLRVLLGYKKRVVQTAPEREGGGEAVTIMMASAVTERRIPRESKSRARAWLGPSVLAWIQGPCRTSRKGWLDRHPMFCH